MGHVTQDTMLCNDTIFGSHLYNMKYNERIFFYNEECPFARVHFILVEKNSIYSIVEWYT